VNALSDVAKQYRKKSEGRRMERAAGGLRFLFLTTTMAAACVAATASAIAFTFLRLEPAS